MGRARDPTDDDGTQVGERSRRLGFSGRGMAAPAHVDRVDRGQQQRQQDGMRETGAWDRLRGVRRAVGSRPILRSRSHLRKPS
jgi:hypothetical protein